MTQRQARPGIRERAKRNQSRAEKLAEENVKLQQGIADMRTVIQREVSHVAFCLRNPRAILIASMLPCGWRARFLRMWTLENLSDMRDLVYHWSVRNYRTPRETNDGESRLGQSDGGGTPDGPQPDKGTVAAPEGSPAPASGTAPDGNAA